MPHYHHVGSSGSPVLLAFIVIVPALVYLRGWLRLRSTANAIASWRAGSFLVGLILIWVAAASRLAAFDHELLTAHMIQHLLLMTVAPPLFWLGAPVMLFLQGLPRRVQAVASSGLAWQPLRRLGRSITHPAFSWLAATAVLVGWHLPAAFALPLHSGAWHVVEHASFLATGLLFWWPVIQPWLNVARPEVSIILYLFLATLPCDILSAFLVFCDRVIYPIYFSSSHPFGLSALADQQCAGALMWTCVTVIYLVAAGILTTQILSARSSPGGRFAQEASDSTMTGSLNPQPQGALSRGH